MDEPGIWLGIEGLGELLLCLCALPSIQMYYEIIPEICRFPKR